MIKRSLWITWKGILKFSGYLPIWIPNHQQPEPLVELIRFFFEKALRQGWKIHRKKIVGGIRVIKPLRWKKSLLKKMPQWNNQFARKWLFEVTNHPHVDLQKWAASRAPKKQKKKCQQSGKAREKIFGLKKRSCSRCFSWNSKQPA